MIVHDGGSGCQLCGTALLWLQVQAKKEERELTISGSRAAPAEAKPVEGEASSEAQQQQANSRRRIERRFGNFSRTFKVRHMYTSMPRPLHIMTYHVCKRSWLTRKHTCCFVCRQVSIGSRAK